MTLPPVAKRVETKLEAHGKSWSDPYAWLRDPAYPTVEDENILSYIRAENGYFDAWADDRSTAIERLHTELKGRIKQDDRSVPVRDGNYEYFWEFEQGAQYRRWCRYPLGQSEQIETVLDEVKLAEGHDYFSLRQMAYSREADLLAYAIDTVGDERYRIFGKNLETGHSLDFELTNTSGSMVWDQSDRFLFYVELNEQLRPFRIRRFDRTKPSEDPTVIFDEQDPGFFVSIGRSSDRQYLCIYAGDHVTREVHVLDLARPLSDPICLSPRRVEHRYSVDHAHGFFYILTNDTHEDFRLVRIASTVARDGQWEEVVAGSDEVYLLDFECFADFMLIASRRLGQSQIEVLTYDGQRHAIDFGIEVYSAAMAGNREFDSDVVRVAMSSPITPATVFDYDVNTRQLTIRKVQEIPSGFNAEQYRCERLWAEAEDRTAIPLTIVRHVDVPLDGTAPLLLYGYGAYGMGTEPGFNANRLSLLDRGIIHAIAHVRGGDELGHAWYRHGKLEKKANTFDDFIACAEKLISDRYTAQGRIAIMGGSAGGMLVGAVLNKRPDLWASAVALVPFVDVLHTMLDDSLPLTPIEWPEWGNPIASLDDFERIHGYCPYTNVDRKHYPPIMVTAGISDPRVTYWEPTKWVAKLRHLNQGRGPIYLKTNMGAGHFGVSGRFDALTEMAQIYAFVLEQFGISIDA